MDYTHMKSQAEISSGFSESLAFALAPNHASFRCPDNRSTPTNGKETTLQQKYI